MKLSLSAIFLLAFAPVGSDAIQCGGALTSPCRGDTDIRYDTSVSNSFDSQSPFFGKVHGYYIGEGTFQGLIDGNPVAGTVFNAENITVVGSRLYGHRLKWLQIPIPDYPLTLNTVDIFATTSFEKDGTGVILDIQQTTVINDNLTLSEGYNMIPADDDSAFYGAFFQTAGTGPLVNGVPDGLRLVESTIFLNNITYTSVYQVFNRSEGEYSLVFTDSSTKTVVTADEYIAKINDVQDNNLVDTRVTLPMRGCWNSENCPTEEKWREQDPNFAESPYQEPSATVKGGAIAGFTVAGIFLLVAVLYVMHRRKMASQKKSIQKRIIR